MNISAFTSNMARLIFFAFMLAAWADAHAQSCAVAPFTNYNVPGRPVLTDNGVGRAMTGWIETNRGSPFTACGDAFTYQISSINAAAVIGYLDGYAVYESNVSGLGVQVGVWGWAMNGVPAPAHLGTTIQYHRGAGTVFSNSTTGHRRSGYDGWTGISKVIRYVKMGDIPYPAPAVRFRFGTDSATRNGITSGPSSVWINGNVTAPAPLCSITYISGATVALGKVPGQQLPSIGSETTIKPFSWRATCGTGGGTKAVSVSYTSATPVVDAKTGLASVTGGAEGVVLQVRRGITAAKPEGDPVEFGTVYSLGVASTSPTEDMGVRYIRNGALKPGQANGGITLNLTYN